LPKVNNKRHRTLAYIHSLYEFIYIRIGIQYVVTYAKLRVRDRSFERLKAQSFCTKLHVAVTFLPVPVAARSKASVCGRSFAGIAGSNHTGRMAVCLLRIFCAVQREVSVMGRSLVQRMPPEFVKCQ
jgi:hypothetical protein